MTAAGPRSRTLAAFKALTPEVVEAARRRSSKPLDAGALRKAARRAGAPVQPPPSNRAAAELLTELREGRQPQPVLGQLLLDALRGGLGGAAENAGAAAAWVGATPKRHGEALRDLLLLVDRLPSTATRRRERFPRIESTAV